MNGTHSSTDILTALLAHFAGALIVTRVSLRQPI